MIEPNRLIGVTRKSKHIHNLDLSQQNAICHKLDGAFTSNLFIMPNRSEERRVGKECLL